MNCYKAKLNKDLIYGFKCEDELLCKIREKWGKDIQKTHKWATFDFEDDKTQLELKNRRCSSTTYPSMMIGLNKILKAEKTTDKKSVFLWNLNDGLFFWDYNKDEYDVGNGGRWDRGKDERKTTAFIPMKHLTKVI